MDSHSAVAQLVESLEPGAMVTRFVVVAEIIDGRGERAIWVETDDGATAWDTAGLLTWALRAGAAQQALDDLDDGE